MSGTIVGGRNGKLVGGLQREFLWPNLVDTETAEVALNDGYADGHVQMDIESGTPTITLQGTDLVDPATNLPHKFLPVKDAAGLAISMTVDSRIQLESLPKYFRPDFAATAGTVSVLVKARGRG